jgi:hypothetical protein
VSCQVRYAIELPRTVGADDTATVGGGSNCGTSSCAGSSSNADGENADASVIITPETARKIGLRSWRSFWSDIGFESFVTSIAGEPYVRLGASAAYPPSGYHTHHKPPGRPRTGPPMRVRPAVARQGPGPEHQHLHRWRYLPRVAAGLSPGVLSKYPH